jgi:hypothetical protein
MGDRAHFVGGSGAQHALGNFPSGPWAGLGARLPVVVGRAQLTNLKEFPIIHYMGTIDVNVAATVTPGVLH